MANYRRHLVAGVVSFGLTYPMFYHICDVIPAFAICVFGSLFPDLDTKSKIQMWTARIMVLTLLGLIRFGEHKLGVIMSAMYMVPICVPHRGLMHELWFLVCVTCAFGVFLTNFADHEAALGYAFYFFVGICSHLLLDRRF